MTATENTNFMRWLATGWTVLLLGGIIYYLWHAWKKRVVTLLGRFGATDISRDINPLLYWGIMCFYTIIAAGLILILILRASSLLKQ